MLAGDYRAEHPLSISYFLIKAKILNTVYIYHQQTELCRLRKLHRQNGQCPIEEEKAEQMRTTVGTITLLQENEEKMKRGGQNNHHTSGETTSKLRFFEDGERVNIPHENTVRCLEPQNLKPSFT